jgi:hypothetical protein
MADGSLIDGAAAAEPFRAGPGAAPRLATGFDAVAGTVERLAGGFPP